MYSYVHIFMLDYYWVLFMLLKAFVDDKSTNLLLPLIL